MKMDTLKFLYQPQDVHAFMRDLFRSDFFKQSYDEKGFVYDIVDRFAQLPRFFFWPSHDDENSHFSSWWGGIQMRDYDNGVIHDLYYLHEIYHAATMVYMPGMLFENFERKMIDNELEASVISEMLFYYEMPEARKHTFPYEIFVDRFLFPNGYQSDPNPESLHAYQDNPKIVMEQLKLQRRNVMMAQTPNMDDDVEFWIQKYTHQNTAWSHNWYARYNLVERAMKDLIDGYKTTGRKESMDQFIGWLTSDEITQGTDIPFPDEAKVFAAMYNLNKKLYKDTFEKAQGTNPVTYKPLAKEFNL